MEGNGRKEEKEYIVPKYYAVYWSYLNNEVLLCKMAPFSFHKLWKAGTSDIFISRDLQQNTTPVGYPQ
jgi:hypothetical protein